MISDFHCKKRENKEKKMERWQFCEEGKQVLNVLLLYKVMHYYMYGKTRYG